MFYAQNPSNVLRFGDVISGFTLSFSNIDNPSQYNHYKINVHLPDHCVVISPCCSIGDKMISLTPLIPVKGGFFDNPYFNPDLSRINRVMDPEQSVAPRIWESLPNHEKVRRSQEEKTYALVEYFIYSPHDLFPSYPVRSRDHGNFETNCYMIDFRNTCKVECKGINNPNDSPTDTKILELTINTRNELRNKIGNFFTRVPIEDRLEEA